MGLLPVLKDIAETLRFFFPQISKVMSKKLSLESVKSGGSQGRERPCALSVISVIRLGISSVHKK